MPAFLEQNVQLSQVNPEQYYIEYLDGSSDWRLAAMLRAPGSGTAAVSKETAGNECPSVV